MSTMKWGWHGKNICLDLCQRTNARGDGWSEHSHEFYEVFWMEEGFCLHSLNGIDSLLGRGDIVFIRPGDRHSGLAVKAEHMVHVNLSLEKETLERIRERYAVKAEHWPWNIGGTGCFTLSPKQIQSLRTMRETIDCRSELDHDLFVLQLLKLVKEPIENDLISLPAWLQQSLKTIHNSRQYSTGVKGLAALSGYSKEHISRIIRSRLNKTAIELLKDLRFEGVLSLLRHTDLSVLEISQEFDFRSEAYFFKTFRTRYGLTPRRYRERHRSQLAARSPDRVNGL